MKEGIEKEKEAGLDEPVENPQEISHDHIKKARGESSKGLLSGFEDGFSSGYKDLMKI